MTSDDTRRGLIEAAKGLLLAAKDAEKITARQIAGAAGANLAMINYCFGSKDALVKTATEEIVAAEFKGYTADAAQPAKERLRGLLYHICGVTVKYGNITRLSVPYILLNAPIELPGELFPFIKEHFGGAKDDAACRIIAYEMIVFFQIALYRQKDFYQYSGVDIQKEAELRGLIDSQLALFLGEENEK